MVRKQYCRGTATAVANSPERVGGLTADYVDDPGPRLPNREGESECDGFIAFGIRREVVSLDRLTVTPDENHDLQNRCD